MQKIISMFHLVFLCGGRQVFLWVFSQYNLFAYSKSVGQHILAAPQISHDPMKEILQWTEDMILLPRHQLKLGLGNGPLR